MKRTQIITISSGKVQGYVENDIEIFKGIPYAEAPIGELRFREPQPKTPWEGVKDATEFGTIAPQNQQDLPEINLPESEDCLYLNIWTPGTDNKERPVMVWIHGGGYLIGAGSRPRSDGARLAAYGDVVVVSFNYRIGAFGFLNLPGIPPNLGMQDQVAALKWVRDNIREFGGNPNNVTIFGESAGGMSVAILLAIPSARGLFHRAIIQSGASNSRDFEPERSKKGGQEFVSKLNLDKQNVDDLRRVPLEKIMKVQKKIVGGLFNVKASPFWPWVDGEVIPEQPLEIIRKGNHQNVPVIIGYNEIELGFISDLLNEAGTVKRKVMLKFIHSLIKKNGVDKDTLNQITDVYKREYGVINPNNEFMYMDGIMSDSMFKLPIIRQLEAHVAHQSNTYLYMFSYKSPKYGFALHTFEIPFVFNTIDKQDVAEGAVELTKESEELIKIMMDTWVHFARSGNPNHKGIPNWPNYDLERRSMMILGIKPRVVETSNDPLREAWNDII